MNVRYSLGAIGGAFVVWAILVSQEFIERAPVHPSATESVSRTRYDYMGSLIRRYLYENSYVGRMDGRSIYLTDPASSACYMECKSARGKSDDLKKCISLCEINPTETNVYSEGNYPDLYYGNLRTSQESASKNIKSTALIQAWLSGSDKRSLIVRFGEVVAQFNDDLLGSVGTKVFRRPMLLEGDTIALYLTAAFEENYLNKPISFLNWGTILYHDLARLSSTQYGLGIYRSDGELLYGMDIENHLKVVEGVLGKKAKSEFFAFGPRGYRGKHWPNLAYDDARTWYINYSGSEHYFYYDRNPRLAFYDPVAESRNLPILSMNGKMVVCEAFEGLTCEHHVISNTPFKTGRIYVEAIYHSKGRGKRGEFWFTKERHPGTEHKTCPQNAIVVTKKLRGLKNGDRLMLLIDLDRGIYHVGRNGDWVSNMEPWVAGEKISRNRVHRFPMYNIGASVSRRTGVSSWELVDAKDALYRPENVEMLSEARFEKMRRQRIN